MPTLVKKYLMALSGLVLVVFVFFHMIGNLQVFLAPEAINKYAYLLHHQVPVELLWLARIGLLIAVGVHIWMAVLIKIENRAARPQQNAVEVTVQASSASRYMIFSGLVLLSFIVFHILHFTIQWFHPEFEHMLYDLDGELTMDIYAIIIYGFSSKFWYVSLFYIIAMGMLCWHLSHGVSSMFQSLGVRNEKWRYRLNKIAMAYGWFLYIGFASIPLAVLLSEADGIDVLPTKKVMAQAAEWKAGTTIQIYYEGDTE